DLLNLGASASTAARRSTDIIIHRRFTTSIHLSNNRVANTLKLLHLVIKLVCLSQLVPVEPLNGLLNSLLNLLPVITIQLRSNLFILDSVPHVVGVVLKSILRLNLLLVLFVF
ncbi:hypothetical protein MIMGU_mgv1a019254mg, partial [Erythranthe guttata]